MTFKKRMTRKSRGEGPWFLSASTCTTVELAPGFSRDAVAGIAEAVHALDRDAGGLSP
jgi:hypothetical protein